MVEQRDGVKNYFNIHEHFFVIDSDNLEEVTTRIYGYSIQENGIIENDNLTAETEKNIFGNGTYVYIQRCNNLITIKQDYNGSYGLYLFRYNKYFAISNSFFLLFDHVKWKFPLSLNRDYCYHILTVNLASLTYAETPINEIELLGKNTVITIDIFNKYIEFDYVDYQELTISPDTLEGISILDSWFKRWTSFITNLGSHTNNILIDLSGGFDTRMMFALVLNSGIDLNTTRINSNNDGLHTHNEDFEIATQISKEFNFRLNKKVFTGDCLKYNIDDVINIFLYTKILFHNEMYPQYRKYIDKRYHITGGAGESIRGLWHITQQELIDRESNLKKFDNFSYLLRNKLHHAIHDILKSSYRKIKMKLNTDNEQSADYTNMLYKYGRCTYHFGRATVEKYCANIYTIIPLLDHDLHKLKLSVPACADNNFVMALIFIRYCKKLLDFKFDSNRAINAETIKFAQIVNSQFPFDISKIHHNNKNSCNFIINTKDSNLIKLEDNNKTIPHDTHLQHLKKIFDSTKTRRLFSFEFDESLYFYANKFYTTTNFFPLRYCYPVIGCAAIINDLIANKTFFEHNIYEKLFNFTQTENRNYSNADNAMHLIESIRDFITARIDLKIAGDKSSDIEFINISDNNAKKMKPEWFQKNGSGYVIQSSNLSIDIEIKSLANGNLTIGLRGKDKRDINNNRIPCWIQYTKFLYNDDIVFRWNLPAWHDKPLVYIYPVAAGQNIKLHIEWEPYSYRARNIPK